MVMETTNLFKQAADNFKTAVDAGVKFQQDAFKMMADALTKGSGYEDVRRRLETMATNSVDMVRKNAESSLKLFDEGCRTSMDLMRKSFETFDHPSMPKHDVFTNTRDLWENTVDAMRATTETATKTYCNAIDSWWSLASKTMDVGCEKTTEKPAAKVAAAAK